MNLNDFNQSKYLASRELPEHGLDLVIAGFDIVKLQDGTSKPAMLFTAAGMKPMLLNRTNRMRLEAIFGTSQTEALIGQRVGVYFDRMVQGPNGDMVGGLRLRPAGGGLAPAVSGAASHAPGFMPNPNRPFIPGPLVTQDPLKQPIPAADGGNWTDEVTF